MLFSSIYPPLLSGNARISSVPAPGLTNSTPSILTCSNPRHSVPDSCRCCAPWPRRRAPGPCHQRRRATGQLVAPQQQFLLLPSWKPARQPQSSDPVLNVSCQLTGFVVSTRWRWINLWTCTVSPFCPKTWSGSSRDGQSSAQGCQTLDGFEEQMLAWQQQRRFP